MGKILKHQDLIVYRKAFELAMQIFEISKHFSKEETYSLTDQILFSFSNCKYCRSPEKKTLRGGVHRKIK